MKSKNYDEIEKSKTNVGNKINFVRETIKVRKLGEKMNQESYKKLFKPVTGKLDDVILSNLVGSQKKILEGPDYSMSPEDYQLNELFVNKYQNQQHQV